MSTAGWRIRKLYVLAGLLLLAGCAVLVQRNLDDHFWVFFSPPDFYDIANTDFFKREGHMLALPAEHQSNSLVLTPHLQYSQLETKYLEAKSQALEAFFDTPDKLKLNLFWDGDGRNPNAALTVYRHFDSATVLKGMVGEPPKTSWVLSYPLIERIHYLLAAGYDVYGNIGHQLNTRLYMDYLRMEGEYNFLIALPQASRIPLRDYWYRKASDDDKDRVYGRIAHFNHVTHLLTEGQAIVPEEHSLDVLPGLVGAYPNAIYRIDRRDLPAFAIAISQLRHTDDYRALMDRFGVRRTNENFWAVSDALHDAQASQSTIEAGLFDYNRLENR